MLKKSLLLCSVLLLTCRLAGASPDVEQNPVSVGEVGTLKARLQTIGDPSEVSADEAYEIAAALYKCRFFPNTAQELRQAKAHFKAVYSEPHPRLGNRSYGETIAEQMQQYAKCKGLTDADLISSTDWWAIAAKKGNTEAQLTYYGYGITPQRAPISATEYNRRMGEYKENALDFLLTALKHGETRALYYLGTAYKDGYIVEHNAAVAAAWLKAYQNCGGTISESEILQLSNNLAPEQVQRSESLALSFEKQYCE